MLEVVFSLLGIFGVALVWLVLTLMGTGMISSMLGFLIYGDGPGDNLYIFLGALLFSAVASAYPFFRLRASEPRGKKAVGRVPEPPVELPEA